MTKQSAWLLLSLVAATSLQCAGESSNAITPGQAVLPGAGVQTNSRSNVSTALTTEAGALPDASVASSFPAAQDGLGQGMQAAAATPERVTVPAGPLQQEETTAAKNPSVMQPSVQQQDALPQELQALSYPSIPQTVNTVGTDTVSTPDQLQVAPAPPAESLLQVPVASGSIDGMVHASAVGTAAANTSVNATCYQVQLLNAPVTPVESVRLQASFVGVPVTATVAVTESGVNCTAGLSVTASNINLSPALLKLWPQAPSAVLNTIARKTYPSLNSRFASGLLYVVATSPEGLVTTTVNQQGLRMMSVDMPASSSFGNVFSGLGVPAAASLGDIISASSTKVVYVPGTTGVVGEDGVVVAPGLRLVSTMSVPALSIPASAVAVLVADSSGAVQSPVTLRWTSSLTPVRFLNLSSVVLTVSQASGMSWQAMGFLVDLPVIVSVRLVNASQVAGRVPMIISSQRVNLLNAARAMWPQLPSIVSNVLQTTTFDSLTSRMPADILYVTASARGLSFKAALDGTSLRMMSVDMPASVSFGAVLSGLGVSGAASLGDTVSVSSTTVVYVPAVGGTGVVGEDGVLIAPGLRLASMVAVPALNIPASVVDVLVAGSTGALQPNITLQWTSNVTPMRFLTLSNVVLTVSQASGSSWQAMGSLVDLPVAVSVRLVSAGQGASRGLLTISAARVNLLNAARAMWPQLPSIVSNVLQTTTFDSLTSRMPADILYITASTGSLTFRAAFDRTSLRMMSVDMPASVSFGAVLSGLGVSGAASLGDTVSVSSTTVQYVPAVGGSGVVDENGTPMQPGLRVSAVVSMPALNISASNVSVLVADGNGVVQPNITLQWGTSSIAPIKFLNMNGVMLTVNQGSGAALRATGSLVDVPVDVRVNLANATAGKRLPVSIAASRINLQNAARTMWPQVPALVTNTLQPLTFDSLTSTMPADIMYVSATSSTINFKAALDDKHLRMMDVSMPNTLSFGSMLSGLGMMSATALGDIITVSSTRVVYVPNIPGVTGVVTDDGTQLVPGLNLSSVVAVPALNIPPSNFNMKVAGADGVPQQNITMRWPSTSPFKYLTLRDVALTASTGGMAWQASGQLADININVQMTPSTGASGNKLSLTISATNVNMLNTAKTLWPAVPDVVMNVLRPLTFARLTSQMSSDILYVTATTSTANFRAALDRENMRMLMVSMPGTISFGSILSGLGVTKAASLGDILTVTATTVVYVPPIAGVSGVATQEGVLLTPGLSVNSTVAVPALSIPSTGVSILVGGADGSVLEDVQVGVNRVVTLAQVLKLDGVVLSFDSDGMVGTTQGTLAEAPISVTVKLANEVAQTRKKLPAVQVKALAEQVRISKMVSSVWPKTPSIIRSVLDPISFAELQVTWDSGSGLFRLGGTPDISQVPALRDVLGFLQLDAEAIAVRTRTNGALEVAVSKMWIFSPGAPFIGDAMVGFDLSFIQDDTSVAAKLEGSFAAVIAIDIFEQPAVTLQCKAGIQFGSSGTDFMVAASASGSMTIKGFPFIEIKVLQGMITVTDSPVGDSPSALPVKAAMLNVKGRLLQTAIETTLVYEAASKVFGMSFSVDRFNLQDTLAAIGINVNLGIANVEITAVKVACATVDIPEFQLQQGMYVAGRLSIFGLTASCNFRFNTDGLRLATALDFSLMFDAVYSSIEDVLSALSIDLGAVGINLREIFFINQFFLDLTLTRARVAFEAGLDLVILGNRMTPRIAIDLGDPKFFAKALANQAARFFTGACTRDSYDRGAGRIPTGCPDGMEMFSGLCYQKCNQNWQYGAYGKDNVCYQNCPPGWDDDDRIGQRGLTCSTLACDNGWEQRGLMCYEPCKPNWSSDGMALCYENCPAGWDYILLNCQRWACNWDEDDNGAGICYKKCDPGWYSDGAFLCLSGCPGGYTWFPLTCTRGYSSTGGKGCCCTIFGCCGCSRVRNEMDGNYDDWYDAGCFCARDVNTVSRSTYWRGSRAKLSSYFRASYIPRQTTAIKSFTKNREDRGIGKIPNVCTDPEFPSYEGGLCYKRCPEGYDVAGILVTLCMQRCPSGYTNCGTFCVPDGIPLGCFAFVGATYQICSAHATTAQALQIADMVVDGNYTAPLRAQSSVSFRPLLAQSWENITLAATGTEPACSTSIDCVCSGVKPGTRFANSFAQTAGFIVCGLNGTYAVQDCSPGSVFDAKTGVCKAAEPSLASNAEFCSNLTDGVHAQRTSSGEYQAVWCSGGQQVPAPDSEQEPSTVTAQGASVAKAVPKDGSVMSSSVMAAAAAANCTETKCFCQAKEDGLYVNTLSRLVQKVASVAAASVDNRARFNLTRQANIYQTYIRCSGGVATEESCPAGQIFFPLHRNCTDYKLPTQGTSRRAPRGCKNAECACKNRVNGLFVNPGNRNEGLVCSLQEGHTFTCPNGFKPKDGKGCAPVNATVSGMDIVSKDFAINP